MCVILEGSFVSHFSLLTFSKHCLLLRLFENMWSDITVEKFCFSSEIADDKFYLVRLVFEKGFAIAYLKIS